MRSTFAVERYARCYPKSGKQYSDVAGKPLYILMPSMQTSRVVNPLAAGTPSILSTIQENTWTALTSSDCVKIHIEIHVASLDECEVKVQAECPTNARFILVCPYI